jgi:hypothetical protein
MIDRIMTDRIDDILKERQKSYGRIEDNFELLRQFKIVVSDARPDLEFIYEEFLNMIFLKISRLLTGDYKHKDSWDDIAGYAKLASEYIDKGETQLKRPYDTIL